MEPWAPIEKPLRGKRALAIDFLRKRVESGYAEIKFSDVQAAIGVNDAPNFKTRIRDHAGFIRELARLGLRENRIGRSVASFVLIDRPHVDKGA